MLADSHLHFFSPGFLETLPEACRRIAPDEVSFYDGLRQAHNIHTALVVGYEGNPAFAGNNDYLATLVNQYDWIKPVAYCRPAGLTLDQIKKFSSQKFIGLCFYLFGEHEATLPLVPDEIWQWLSEQQALVSVNARGQTWALWRPILDRHPQLRLLISHMGLPGRWSTPLTPEQARTALSTVLPLASYPNTHVKASAFYALSDPMYDYPHPQTLPVLDALADAFGIRRIMWGSDYSPSLEFVSFRQTLASLDRWTRLNNADDKAAVMGQTLMKLIAESRMGQTR